jgi:endonuclease YncB( thermonuclease family)
MRRASIAVFAVLLAGLSLVDAGAAEVHSLVYINGRPTRVYFNDGDSFRQLNGPYTGRGSRLGGFNTLESFGPAHAWGTWHPYELWINAKLATYNGRRGIWHCTSDGSTDTYGRVLLDCPDLAIDQIRRGYAHAMNIDDTPARPEYLRAQQEAIAARRGMWAHGVPSFVLTSLHSRDEDPTKDQHKNRMVSVRDGHSEPWIHDDRYDECEWVCANEIVADEAAVRDFARTLRADPEVAPALANTSNLLLIELVDRYARLGTVPEYTTPEVRALVEPRLEAAKREGRLGEATERLGACAVYVDFRRRYGLNRALCMRGRGEIPPQLRALRGLE